MTWFSTAALVLAGLTLISGWLLNRAQIRSLRIKLGTELAEQRRELRTADAEAQAAARGAHTAAQTALASSAQQLAQASYQLADRLQADLDRLRNQAAVDALAARDTITHLETQVAVMRGEIDTLRRQVQSRV